MERVDALTEAVRSLTQQIAPEGQLALPDRVDVLTREMHRRTSWWRACVAVGIVLLLALAGAAVVLELRTRAEIAEANRKMCPLVALLIPDIGGREPTTEYGRQLAEQARVLYAAYGCPNRSAHG